MAERISALARLSPSDASDVHVTLAEMRPAALFQVQAWPDTLPAVQAALRQALGIGTLPGPGHARAHQGSTIAALGAGRFMLAAADDETAAAIGAAFATGGAAIIDVSHGRTILTLDGEAAAALIARCAALDLDRATFPPGRVAQTAIHHVDVLVRRVHADSFEVWALRSFAESLVEWIVDAGAEIGLRFDAGERAERG